MNEIIPDIIKMLKEYSGENVSPLIIQGAVDMAKNISFKKGEIIMNSYNVVNNVYYIISGLVRSYYFDHDGNDITGFFCCENQFIMSESLFSKSSSIYNYEALEDCHMLCINAGQLKQLVLSDTVLCRVYISFLEAGISYKMSRESSLLTQSASERYLSFKRAYPDLENRVNQYHIASYLGITPESLSRIRRSLREEI